MSARAGFGKVAVLMGGKSAEREISLLTGGAVLKALVERGVDAISFDPSERPLTDLVSAGIDRVWIALHGPGGLFDKITRRALLLARELGQHIFGRLLP